MNLINNTKTLPHKILRLPDVMASTGLSRSSIYLYIELGLFPRPIKLGKRAVGWPAHEVAEVNLARIAGMTNKEIYALVNGLIDQRKSKF